MEYHTRGERAQATAKLDCGKGVRRTRPMSHLRLSFVLHRGVRIWMIALCADEEENHTSLLAFGLVLEEYRTTERHQEVGESGEKRDALVIVAFWADHLLVRLKNGRLAVARPNGNRIADTHQSGIRAEVRRHADLLPANALMR